ncbi:hypothetical protein H1R20_g16509, partial [Candolleomyces eurysporus]
MSQGYLRYPGSLYLDNNERYGGFSTYARSQTGGSDPGDRDRSQMSLYSTPGPSRSQSPDTGYDQEFGNPRFRELWQENIRLKADIEALRVQCKQERANAAKFCTLLSDALKQPTSGTAPTLPSSSPNQPVLGHVASGQEQLQRELDKLPPLPPSPNALDPQFKTCRYWFPSDVTEESNLHANNGQVRMTKWEHITDGLGNVVSEQILDAVFAKLTSIWDFLHYVFMAPMSWGVKPPIVTLYVKTMMYKDFPWLQYCDAQNPHALGPGFQLPTSSSSIQLPPPSGSTQPTPALASSQLLQTPPVPSSEEFKETGASGSEPPRASTSDFEFSYSRSASPSSIPPQKNAQELMASQPVEGKGTKEMPSSIQEDLFASIDIPPPAKTAPIIQGPSQPPLPRKPSGNAKPEAPTTAVTARNVCLIDYIKFHGASITKIDFTAYFNQQLPPPVRKQRKKVPKEEQLQPSSILKNYLKTLPPSEELTPALPPS